MVSVEYYKMETQMKIYLRSDRFLDWLNGSRYNIKFEKLSDANKTQINNKFTTKWKQYKNKFAIAAHSPKTGPQGVVRWRQASMEHLGSLNKHLYSIFSDRSGQAGEISPLIAYKARFHLSDHRINPLSTVSGILLSECMDLKRVSTTLH